MPWKEYARYALRMAELDDAIERSELDGSTIEGKTIVFPPKSESVQQRYHLFLSVNRRKSRNVLRGEIARMEQRLRESGRYAEQPKKELSADWAEQNERADKT